MVGENVDVLESAVLLPARVRAGHLAVAGASSPYSDVPTAVMTCFVVLASWRSPIAPVGMLVTCLQLPGQIDRTVNLVYADPDFVTRVTSTTPANGRAPL